MVGSMKQEGHNKLSDQLRMIVETCGKSRYQIAKETGIDESALSRFAHGERGLSMSALDQLGECLDLTVAVRARKRKGR